MHILLHGPPGTGKTDLVECAARRIRRAAEDAGRQFRYFNMSAASFTGSASTMHAQIVGLFKVAAETVSVVFLDECDMMLRRDNRMHEKFKSIFNRDVNLSATEAWVLLVHWGDVLHALVGKYARRAHEPAALHRVCSARAHGISLRQWAGR